MSEIYTLQNNFDHCISICKKNFEKGNIGIIPTDTIYGISGNYFNSDAKNRISLVKQRPSFKSYIVLLSNADSLQSFADQEIPQSILNLLPAPLTLIVKNKYEHLYEEQTIAIRIPTNQWLQALLHQIKFPLISTSANISGQPTPSNNQQIIHQFQDKVDFIILEHKIQPTLPSTILDISIKPFKILRQGNYRVDPSILSG